MNRFVALLTVVIIAGVITVGCSSSGGGSPVTPTTDQEQTPELTTESNRAGSGARTNLLGYWDVYIDAGTGTVELVQDRHAMFTVNLTNILSKQITGLNFEIINIIIEPDHIDVDIDIIVTHPFSGYPEFNGYDLRGIFMGDGSLTLEKGSLKYPELGVDQYMLPDTIDGAGGPDGYTRWFNFTEFSEADFPLFSFTAGKITSLGFAGTATLCPYKYYADGLQPEADLWNWLKTHGDQNGVFSQSVTNTRNFYIRFPTPEPGLQFSVAIIVSWEGLEPEYHPANCPEAIACEVTDNSYVYYVDPMENGGYLYLDISLFGWDYQPSKIYIESTVLNLVYEFTTDEMIPVDEGDHYATYHVEIPADNVTGIEGQEYWVIAEYEEFDYTNDFGVPNLAGTDPMAACFRYDLEVIDEPPWIEVLIPNGGEKWLIGTEREITWDSWNVSGTVFIDYSKSNFIDDINPIAIDEPIDGSFIWEIPDDESDTVRVRISSTGIPGVYDISDEDFRIVSVGGWARTWGGIESDGAYAVATDDLGGIYVTGGFMDTVDFDPDGGDPHTSNGDTDAYLSKFDTNGNFQWARTWGGSDNDYGRGIAADGNGNVYVTGKFRGIADFDPNGGDPHTSNGDNDVFLSKFDSSGNFEWAHTWGGSDREQSLGAAADGSGNVYVTGVFEDTVDFDPDPGDEDLHTSGVDSSDVFLSKFDSSGNHEWAQTWGATVGYGVAADGPGNVYVTGSFEDTVDFNPDPGVEDPHTSNGSGDIYLSKFDSSGNFEWARTWGGETGDQGAAVAIDGYANVYVTGNFTSTADFDPDGGDPHTSNGDRDSFLSKFDSSGSFEWALTWGGSSWDISTGVAIDGLENVYVAGEFKATVDFDPDGGDPHTSNGFTDRSLSKFDSMGNFGWARTWGGPGWDMGIGVAADSSGNSYVAGTFEGTVDFAPSGPPCNDDPDFHNSHGGQDAHLAKYLPDGCW